MIKAHQTAAAIANQKTIDKFGDSDFDIGSEKHAFWIAAYDAAYASYWISNG